MARAPKQPEHDHDHANCCGGHTVNSDPQVLQQLQKRLKDIEDQRGPVALKPDFGDD